jgi:GDP-L-fucose synthase
MSIDLSTRRVLVTGGSGFLGRAVCRRLRERGCDRILAPGSTDFDLTREEAVSRMYDELQPDLVIHLAGAVGGIGANADSPGRFFHTNLAMALHLIEHARRSGIEKFVQVGTVCQYAEAAPLPLREDDLWNGYPEPRTAAYGIAKRAAMVMLDAYRRQYGLASACVLPVNLYGPGDNFDPRTSHVVAALIRKCVEAVERGEDHIVCWGTGEASREFLYVDDAAEGVLRAAEVVDEPIPINLGTGREITIRELVDLIAKLTVFEGEIRWDASKPDGRARLCLDVTRARERLGWEAQVSMEEGLRSTIEWWRSTGRNAVELSSTTST